MLHHGTNTVKNSWLEHDCKRKANKAFTNGGLSFTHVALRNEERTFLPQTGNTGDKKCVFL